MDAVLHRLLIRDSYKQQCRPGRTVGRPDGDLVGVVIVGHPIVERVRPPTAERARIVSIDRDCVDSQSHASGNPWPRGPVVAAPSPALRRSHRITGFMSRII